MLIYISMVIGIANEWIRRPIGTSTVVYCIRVLLCEMKKKTQERLLLFQQE